MMGDMGYCTAVILSGSDGWWRRWRVTKIGAEGVQVSPQVRGELFGVILWHLHGLAGYSAGDRLAEKAVFAAWLWCIG